MFWHACASALLVLSVLGPQPALRVLDLTGGTPPLPLEDACGDLGARARIVKPSPGRPPALTGVDVVVVDGATQPARLGWAPDALPAFVRSGGGLLIAGLPGDLPRTAALWRVLGEAAPATVPAADLFPDNRGDWIWIPPRGTETADHLRYVRKSFTVDKPVRRAFIRCTADNLYWVFLNGEQVGYHWSWYDHELWDITARLKQGQNVVAFKARNVDGPGGLFAQVGIEYADGTRQIVASDRSWRFHSAEQPGWAGLALDDSSWEPPTEVIPMSAREPLPDVPLELKGRPVVDAGHPVLHAMGASFGLEHSVRGVVPRAGAVVLARVGKAPVLVARRMGKGRVMLLDAVGRPGGLVSSGVGDDLIAAAILWLGRRTEGLRAAEVVLPPPTLVRRGGDALRFAVRQPRVPVACVLTAQFRRDGRPVGKSWRLALQAGGSHPAQALKGALRLAGPGSEGLYEFALTARDRAGRLLFHRDTTTEVRNAVNLSLAIPSNRAVTAEGLRMEFTGTLQGRPPAGSVVRARLCDARGRSAARVSQRRVGGVWRWSLRVPHLDEGEYRLVARICAPGGQVVDESQLPFWVVPRLDLTDFFPATMCLFMPAGDDRRRIERAIDDIIAHGFNTLTFNAHRLGAGPSPPLDYAEDYAQRRGMAISYSFQGDFSNLDRDAPPPVSVYAPDYRDSIRPGIERAAATCRLVPRLLYVQGYMDEPFQVSGKTFDDRPPARAEYWRRYGTNMPTREEAMKTPAEWLRYVEFWSDSFAAGLRHSYALVKEICPEVRVELTHDSHCTFGAAGDNFRGYWAVDDVYHWGAPFDAVNYDIYPYLSTDYRRGKFEQNRLPRIAGMHMAFAEMRNLAYTYGKKLGFWLESGWGGKLADPALSRYHWSPRELTYTALAAGCDYLNTFWGVPEDPRWWECYRRVMREVKSVAPLLTRSRVPRARAAFLFPRTQHVLLQEEYWNVMVALEAFRRAYGELDCIHEDQLSEGRLREYGALVLFDIHLMKRASAEAIREWCRSGGLLVADEVPSLDEDKRPLGVFEPVFGVSGTAVIREGPFALSRGRGSLWGLRSYRSAGATPAADQAGDGPAVLRNAFGAGSARLLNFPLKDCYLDALVRKNRNGDADGILAILRAALEGAPAPNVRSSNPEIEAAVRRTPEGTTLLLLVNHEGAKPRTRVTVPCARPGGVVRDLVSGRRLPHGPGYTMELRCPWGTTRLIGLFPSDPKGLRLMGLPKCAKPGETIRYAAVVRGGTVRGNYLLDVCVFGPDGRRREAFSGRTCTRNAVCARTIRLPLNAPRGTWRVTARSAWDGARAAGTFEVR